MRLEVIRLVMARLLCGDRIGKVLCCGLERLGLCLRFDRLRFDRLRFDRLRFDRLKLDSLSFDCLRFDPKWRPESALSSLPLTPGTVAGILRISRPPHRVRGEKTEGYHAWAG